MTLIGAEPFTTLDSLRKRFYEVGFTLANAITLRDIRRACLDPGELERVSQLELLDEVEELELVLGHYAISWGLVGDGAWGEWGLKERASLGSDK